MKKKILTSIITLLLLLTCAFSVSAADKELVDVSNLNIQIPTIKYNGGEAVTPKVLVYYQGRLTEEKHYKVSFKNNRNVGENATATITGIKENGFTGKVSVKFTIAPRLPMVTYNPDKTTDTYFELTLEHKEEISGYSVKLEADGVSTEKNFDTTETTLKFKNLTPDTLYDITITPYTIVDGKKIKSVYGYGNSVRTRAENYTLKEYNKDEINVVIDNVEYYLDHDRISHYDGESSAYEDAKYADHYIASGVIYDESITEINVLSEVNGLPVTKIDLNLSSAGDEGFDTPEKENMPNVKKITLSSNATEIDEYSFTFLPGVEELVIPEGVKTIGKAAFANMKSLKRITLPSTIYIIPNYAFRGCEALETIIIPINVKRIGYRAFNKLENLKEVIILSELEEISEGAFTDCKNLTKINFPDSLREIGPYAFRRSGVVEVTIPDECHFSYHSFRECENLKKVTIHYTDKEFYGYTIPKYAFTDSKNLEGIYFTGLSTKLNTGVSAFKGCDSLKDIYYFGNKTQWQEKCMTGSRTKYYDKFKIHCYYDHIHAYKEVGEIHTCKKGTTVFLRCNCGDEYEYTLKNTSTHSFTSWKVTKKATLTEKGTAERTCTLCGEVQTKKLVHVGSLKISFNKKQYLCSGANKPRVSVKDGKTYLTKSTHYKVSYKNNTKPGYGVAVIKGVVKYGYYGTTEVKFKIVPHSVYYIRDTKITSSSVKLSWLFPKEATTVTICLKDEKTGKLKELTTTEKESYTVKNLKSNTSYTFVFKTYTISNGEKFYALSEEKTVKTK